MVPYLHQFSASVLFGKICIIFGANKATQLKNNHTGTAPSIGAIWDGFSTKAPKMYHI